MISRRLLVYVLAAVCTVVGVRMALTDKKPAGGDAAVGGGNLETAEPTSRLPGALGGYNGTGKSQIVFEGETRPVAPPAQVKERGEVRSKTMSEGDRRRADLKRVLDNIDNEPVYVEGVDGPAPDAKRKSR